MLHSCHNYVLVYASCLTVEHRGAAAAAALRICTAVGCHTMDGCVPPYHNPQLLQSVQDTILHTGTSHVGGQPHHGTPLLCLQPLPSLPTPTLPPLLLLPLPRFYRAGIGLLVAALAFGRIAGVVDSLATNWWQPFE
jgi:hypothetical protein